MRLDYLACLFFGFFSLILDETLLEANNSFNLFFGGIVIICLAYPALIGDEVV